MDEELKKIRDADKPKKDLKPAVRQLAKGKYIPDIKLEIRAITATYLGEIFEEFKAALAELSEGEGIKQSFEKKNPSNPDLEKFLTNLHLFLFEIWKRSATKWMNKRNTDKSDKIYLHSKAIVRNVRYDQMDDHFSQGFNTSLDVMLGLIELFINKYKESFAKEPKTEEIEAFMASPEALRIIMTMANASLDNFSIFADKTMKFIGGRRSGFKTEVFELEKNDKGFALKLSKGIAHYKPEDIRRITRDEVRTGCPALLVKDDGVNMIVSTWEILKQIFREVYYPTLEERRK